MIRRITEKQKNRGAGKTKKDGLPKRGGEEVEGGGQTLNGFYRKTGLRNRRYQCNGEYHLAPRCP